MVYGNLSLIRLMTDESVEPVLDIDAIFHLLSEHQRRFALYYLFGQDRPVPLEELVEQVIMRKNAFTPDSREKRQDIRRDFEVIHLPELVDYGIVTYNSQTHIVKMNDGFPLLSATIQHAEQYEPFEELSY